MDLLSLPEDLLARVAGVFFDGPPEATAPTLFGPIVLDSNYCLSRGSLAVLATCRRFSRVFALCHSQKLAAALGKRLPAAVDFADALGLSRAERMRFALGLERHWETMRGGRDADVIGEVFVDNKPVDSIIWPRDPISPAADLDLRHVHVLLTVQLHGTCLLSAHGPWLPQDDTISLSMTPRAPSFTTPEPVFEQPVPTTSWPGTSEQANAWLQTADVVRSRHLGTCLNTKEWGEAVLETAMSGADGEERNKLQVDLHLLQVYPAASGRAFRFCELLHRARHFRTQTDCTDPPMEGISIHGDKIAWELSGAYPFVPPHLNSEDDSDDDSEEEYPFQGTSEDGIVYAGSSWVEDSWIEVDLKCESLATASAGEQVHSINSVSLNIVWQSGLVQGREALNLLPSRQFFSWTDSDDDEDEEEEEEEES